MRVPPFVDVIAMRVADGPPGLFPFEVVGMDVLGLGASPLSSQDQDPSDWPVAAPVSLAPYLGANLTLGNAVMFSAKDNMVYLYGSYRGAPRSRFSRALVLRPTRITLG